jgi:hypothetical protein
MRARTHVMAEHEQEPQQAVAHGAHVSGCEPPPLPGGRAATTPLGEMDGRRAGSYPGAMDDPLPPLLAMKRIHALLEDGTVIWSIPRAQQELDAGQVSRVDCINVLRSGIVQAAEGRAGAWRYPVRTVRFSVVVELIGDATLLVRAAWREAT